MEFYTQLIDVDGKPEPLISQSDIIRIAQIKCGYEYALIIEDLVKQSDYNEILAEKKAQTDEQAYCEQVESLECCLRDILEEVEFFQREMDNSKRLQRAKVEELLSSITRMINNEL